MSTHETELDFLEKAQQLASRGRLAPPELDRRKNILKAVVIIGTALAIFAYFFPSTAMPERTLYVYNLLLWMSFGVVVVAIFSMSELYFQELNALRTQNAYSLAEEKDAVDSLSLLESRMALLTQDSSLNQEISAIVIEALVSNEKGTLAIEKSTLEARLHQESVGAKCVKLLTNRVYKEVT